MKICDNCIELIPERMIEIEGQCPKCGRGHLVETQKIKEEK